MLGWHQLPLDGSWSFSSNNTPGPTLDWIICHLLSNRNYSRKEFLLMGESLSNSFSIFYAMMAVWPWLKMFDGSGPDKKMMRYMEISNFYFSLRNFGIQPKSNVLVSFEWGHRLVNIFWEDIVYSAYLPLHISLGVFTTHPSTFFEWRIYSSCETFKMKGWEEKKIEKYFELSWVWKRFLVSMEGRCWWCWIWFPEISNIYHVIKSPTNQIIERQISKDR